MESENQPRGTQLALTILVWGALWGIFEATAGYLLHLLPLNIGWAVWTPVACFFMTGVYRRTGRPSAVVCVGFLCAAIKLLNLLLPGRLDRVLNPAVSIVLESLALAAVVYAVQFSRGRRPLRPLMKAAAALAMNTLWRGLYILYLLLIAPGWIRDLSVISTMEQFIRFFVTQNLITSLVLFAGYQFLPVLFRPADALERRLSALGAGWPARSAPALRVGIAAALLGVNAALVLLL